MRRRSGITASIGASGCILLAVCRLAAAEVASNGKHCLWRVTNARAPFYLLGSVHALQPSDYFRTPVIEEAIKQSQQIWFEVDPKDESFGEKLRDAAKLPKGQLVQSKIHPKTYEYLRKITLIDRRGSTAFRRPARRHRIAAKARLQNRAALVAVARTL